MTRIVSSRRLALVTGGNRGIGRATVEALVAAGIDVIFTHRSHGAEAADVAATLTGAGRTVVTVPLDMDSSEQVRSFPQILAETLRDRWGREQLDILVNNAGFGGDSVLGGTEEHLLDELFRVHVKSVYLLTQALVDSERPLLADGGSIVNVSSGLTRFVGGPYSAYAAMKGAVEVLTRYWAQELGSRGITVNTVAPGPVVTDFAGGQIRNNVDMQNAMAKMTALGRIATPDDIGPAIAALVGDNGRWVTAQRIELSGGFRL